MLSLPCSPPQKLSSQNLSDLDKMEGDSLICRTQELVAECLRQAKCLETFISFFLVIHSNVKPGLAVKDLLGDDFNE